MKRRGPRPKPVRQRIEESVEVSADGCWVWQLSLRESGYGQIWVGSWSDNTRRSTLAHRASYEAFVGHIPDGFQIDHLCRNRRCVNPDHLEPVTAQINSLRRSAAANSYEICPKGHRQTSVTVGTLSGARIGKKVCLPCHGKVGRL